MRIFSQEVWEGLRFYISKEMPGGANSATPQRVIRLLTNRTKRLWEHSQHIEKQFGCGGVFLGDSGLLFPSPFRFPFSFKYPLLLSWVERNCKSEAKSHRDTGFEGSILGFFRSFGQEENKRVLWPAITETSVASPIYENQKQVLNQWFQFPQLYFTNVKEAAGICKELWSAASRHCALIEGRGSQLWYYWYLGRNSCLLQGKAAGEVGRVSVQCLVGWLAATLDSTH